VTEHDLLGSRKLTKASGIYPILRLLRLTNINDFFLHYIIIIVFVAATFTTLVSQMDGKFPLLIAFSVSSALFGCVVNDLFDAEIDEQNPETSNPLARGEIGKKTIVSIILIFLTVSILFLSLLPSKIVPLGVISLIIDFTYSWGVRARLRPILDLLYHGAHCAIPFIMVYALYIPFDGTGLFVTAIIWIGGAISELMREVRNYDFDRTYGKTTVVMLGVRKSLVLCLGLMFVWLSLIGMASERIFFFPLKFFGFIVPIQFLVLPPLSLFILMPIIKGIKNETYQTDTRVRFRKKAIYVLLILVSISVAVLTYSSKRVYYGDMEWENYVIGLDVRTVISGPDSWSVAFIRFRYLDEANHYYLLMDRNGVLELTKVVGSEKTFLRFVETGLSPFDWHSFEIKLYGTSINVSVDDVLYLDIEDGSLTRGVVCLTGICSARLAFFKEVKVLPV